jgi:hypothetical protein
MLITVAMVIIVNTRRPIEYAGFLPPGVVEEETFFDVGWPDGVGADGGGVVREVVRELFESDCVIGFGSCDGRGSLGRWVVRLGGPNGPPRAEVDERDPPSESACGRPLGRRPPGRGRPSVRGTRKAS